MAHREPRLHRWAEAGTEAVLLGMVVFSPWALATTVPWAAWTMNGAAYVLGALLALKWLVRARLGFGRLSWQLDSPARGRRLLAGVTLMILAWCWLHAANAREAVNAVWQHANERPAYLPWLPHSLDPRSSWGAFWVYLGLAAVFWAARDWLCGMSRREAEALAFARGSERATAGLSATPSSRAAHGSSVVGPWHVPRRLRRLLWVLSLNTGLVAVVALFQRHQGTDRLLWVFTDPLGREAGAHFGPFPYRNNGAAFVNLVWPVTSGLWWCLHHRRAHGRGRVTRSGGSPHVVLPLLALFMIAGPMIAASRGGFLVTAAVGLGLLPVFMLGGARQSKRAFIGGVATLLAAAAFGVWVGWGRLSSRLFPDRWVLETGVSSLPAFSLRCVFDVVKPPLPAWGLGGGLMGLSDSKRLMYGRPGAAFLTVRGNGALAFGLFDPPGQPRLYAELSGFLANHLGQTVEVVAVSRGTNGSLFLNGRPAGGPGDPPVRPADVPRAFPALALWVKALAGGSMEYPGTVREAAIYGEALSPGAVAELAAARGAGRGAAAASAGVPAPLRRLNPDRPSLAEWWLNSTRDRREVHRFALDQGTNAPAWSGTGPGTFPALLRRQPGRLEDLVDPHAHNDWIETRLTFGWVGFALVLCALLLALAMPPRGQGIPGLTPLRWFILVSLSGCLLHAWQDFPLQNHAILFVFLLLLAAVTCLSWGSPPVTGLRLPGHPTAGSRPITDRAGAPSPGRA